MSVSSTTAMPARRTTRRRGWAGRLTRPPSRRRAGSRGRSAGMRVEPGLEDEDGGGAVDHLAAAPAAEVRLQQRPLRLHGGQPLVPRFDREPGEALQAPGESFDDPGPLAA